MDMHMTIPSAPFGAAARVRGKAGANIAAQGTPRGGGRVKGVRRNISSRVDGAPRIGGAPEAL